MIKNSVPIESLPESKLVTLFDLHTGNTSKLSALRFDKLSDSKAGMVGGYSDFNRRHYLIDDYKGQSIDMFHLVSGKKIECMTLSLFSEIQKRNPAEKIPVYENGKKISETYEPWKHYLALPEEIGTQSIPKQEEAINQVAQPLAKETSENKPKLGRRKKIINE